MLNIFRCFTLSLFLEIMKNVTCKGMKVKNVN